MKTRTRIVLSILALLLWLLFLFLAIYNLPFYGFMVVNIIMAIILALTIVSIWKEYWRGKEIRSE